MLSASEVYGNSVVDYAKLETRQLDYYKNYKSEDGSIGVTTENYTGAAKGKYWWLRTSRSNASDSFFTVRNAGLWTFCWSNEKSGLAMAFRI